MSKHIKRSANGRFAPNLVQRIKKAQKKAPKTAQLPVEHVDELYVPPARVTNAKNIDFSRFTRAQAGSVAAVMENAMQTPRNDDERQFITHQRKMLENVFGPINWDA